MFTDYPDILTVEDIMEMLMIGKNRVYKLLKHKEIKGIRMGKNWRIPKEAVIDYIINK